MCAMVQLFIHNDAKCKRLEDMYMTSKEDPQVSSSLNFCILIYVDFLDLS